MTPLCELALKYQTDKGGNHTLAGEVCHNYTPYYYHLLQPNNTNIKRVLEIGVNQGGSLRMWEEFFPNALVFGLDNKPNCLFNSGRIRCILADQGDPASLWRAMGIIGKKQPALMNVIVDDGSHEVAHQIISMHTLLPYLTNMGFYIIEDFQSEDALEQTMAAVPSGYDIGMMKCHGAIGPPRTIEKLLVIRRCPD